MKVESIKHLAQLLALSVPCTAHPVYDFGLGHGLPISGVDVNATRVFVHDNGLFDVDFYGESWEFHSSMSEEDLKRVAAEIEDNQTSPESVASYQQHHPTLQGGFTFDLDERSKAKGYEMHAVVTHPDGTQETASAGKPVMVSGPARVVMPNGAVCQLAAGKAFMVGEPPVPRVHDDDLRIARVAYEAYCKAIGQQPAWAQLSDREKLAWDASAGEVWSECNLDRDERHDD